MPKTLSQNIDLSFFPLLKEFPFFNNKVLHIHTSKGRSVVGTTLSVMEVKDNCMSCTLFHDYSKRVDGISKRATEKALKDHHIECMKLMFLDEIIEEIQKHYKEKGSI
jgi:hypothetical protein